MTQRPPKPTPLVPLFGNSFGSQELRGIKRVFDSHLVGTGSVVTEFETQLKVREGFAHAVAVSSCTNGFWLLLQALQLSKQQEVIIPNIHFFGIRNVLELTKTKYRICDVRSDSPVVGVDQIKQVLRPTTAAIFLLEYGGYQVDIKAIQNYLKTQKQKVLLVMDAANSSFSVDGQPLRHDYDVVIHSFDMNKILVTGDGGMILTNNSSLADQLRVLAYHGIKGFTSSYASASHNQRIWWEMAPTIPTLKLAMNNVTASIGLAQLKRVSRFQRQRRHLRDRYFSKLKHLEQTDKLKLPPLPSHDEEGLYFFWLQLPTEQLRTQLAYHLKANGIYTNVKYQPLKSLAVTPNANSFYETSLCLPLHQNVSPTIQTKIITEIEKFMHDVEPARRRK